MTLRALLATCLLLACSAFAPPASAAISCLIASNPSLEFGTVPSNPTVTSSVATSVDVWCFSDGEQRANVCLKLSDGAPDSTLLPQRRMANGAARLSYQVTRDSASVEVWGTGGAAQPQQAVIPLAQIFGNAYFGARTFQMYGRLQGGQTGLPSGLYASDMTLSLTGGVDNNANCNGLNNVQDAVPVRARATLGAACTLAANPLNFGTVNVLSANIDATTSLGLTCTNGAAYTIRMGGGTVTGNVAGRRMGTGGAGPGVINYQLRHGSATGALWGDGTAGTTVLTGTGSGTPQTVTVYGRVPGGQPAPPVGTYSDTVTVSVEY